MNKNLSIIQALTDLVDKHSILERGISTCKISLKSIFHDPDFEDKFSGHDLNRVKISIKKHGLVFLNSDLDYPYIESLFDITYMELGNDSYPEDLGEYRYISSMDGEFIDEYLNIEGLY